MSTPNATMEISFADSMALIPKAAPDNPTEKLGGIDIPVHPLDTEPMKQLHMRLLMLKQQELDRQHANRQQQALDEAFYHSKQWDHADAVALQQRGQVPIVFNHIKPVVNYIIGSETRTRSDFKILGRGPEDVKGAEVKTAYLKYLSDANDTAAIRSKAFRDATIVGVGWVETGASYGDDGEELYDRYESWRSILWDSRALSDRLDDARYLFRTRYLDIDMLITSFDVSEERLATVLTTSPSMVIGGTTDEISAILEDELGSFGANIRGAANVNVRERVQVTEAWYRTPVMVTEFRGGPLHKQPADRNNPEHQELERSGQAVIIQRYKQQMRCAIFTDGGLLWEGESPYKHDSFPFTPIWCYRDGETGLPYGVVRDLRDLQYDINKRASKALYILSTNKVMMEKGAVDNVNDLADEVARPDAIIEYNKGYKLDLNVDRELAPAHLDMMHMSAQMIQSTSGVTDEQLGRRTNAISGAAITARQEQGSLQTACLFDNLRSARKWHGEKVLANVETFVTDMKVIRITNAKGADEFQRINDPDLPESILAASRADYIVSDSPQTETFRQAQAEQISLVLQRMPPDVAALFMPTLLDLMDVPNKDETIKLLREKLGLPDPNAEQTPEQQQVARQQQKQQQMAELMQSIQLATAQNQLAKLQAETSNIEAKTVRERVAAMGEAVQTAATATQAAPIAVTADEMLASAGFADQVPLVPPTALPPQPAQAMPAGGQLPGAM